MAADVPTVACSSDDGDNSDVEMLEVIADSPAASTGDVHNGLCVDVDSDNESCVCVDSPIDADAFLDRSSATITWVPALLQQLPLVVPFIDREFCYDLCCLGLAPILVSLLHFVAPTIEACFLLAVMLPYRFSERVVLASVLL